MRCIDDLYAAITLRFVHHCSRLLMIFWLLEWLPKKWARRCGFIFVEIKDRFRSFPKRSAASRALTSRTPHRCGITLAIDVIAAGLARPERPSTCTMHAYIDVIGTTGAVHGRVG
jgi:hypothetical protein